MQLGKMIDRVCLELKSKQDEYRLDMKFQDTELELWVGLWPQCMCCACHLLVLNFGERDKEIMSREDEAQTKFWEQAGGAKSRFKTGLIQRSIQTINYK